MIDDDRVDGAIDGEAAVSVEDVDGDEVVSNRAAILFEHEDRESGPICAGGLGDRRVRTIAQDAVTVEDVEVDRIADRVLPDDAVLPDGSEAVAGDVDGRARVVEDLVVPDDVVARLDLNPRPWGVDAVAGAVGNPVVFDDRPLGSPREDEGRRPAVGHHVAGHDVVDDGGVSGLIAADLDQAVAAVRQAVIEHPVSAGAVGDPDTVAGVGPLVAGVDDLVALDDVVAGLGDPDAVAPDGGVATPRDVRAANDIVVGAGGDLDGIAGDVLDPELLDHDIAPAGIEQHRAAGDSDVQYGRRPGIARELDGPSRGPRDVRRDPLPGERPLQHDRVALDDGLVGPVERPPGRARGEPVVRVVAAGRVRVERPVERHGVRHGEAERGGLDPFARGVVRLGGDRVLAVRGAGRAPPDVVRSLSLDPFLHVAVDSEIHADEPRLVHDVGSQPHHAGHRR